MGFIQKAQNVSTQFNAGRDIYLNHPMYKHHEFNMAIKMINELEYEAQNIKPLFSSFSSLFSSILVFLALGVLGFDAVSVYLVSLSFFAILSISNKMYLVAKKKPYYEKIDKIKKEISSAGQFKL